MVDVSLKPPTQRIAVASGRVAMKAETLRRIMDKEIEKGDVLGVARVAGIMAAKRTGEVIPLLPSFEYRQRGDFFPAGCRAVGSENRDQGKIHG